MMLGRIVVYSTSGCKFCIGAKTKLQELGLQYTDIPLDIYPQEQQRVFELTNKKSVPQIFFNDLHIGGYNELENLIISEKINDLIDYVKKSKPNENAPLIPDTTTAVGYNKNVNARFKCTERDKYSSLIQDMLSSTLLSNIRTGLFSVKRNSFTGKQFVKWYMGKESVGEDIAIGVGQSLLQANHLRSSQSTSFDSLRTVYTLVEAADSHALNGNIVSECAVGSPLDASEDLRKLILRIYEIHLAKDGKSVDYDGIKRSELFKDYCTAAAQLKRVTVVEMTRKQKLAFFINVYNALVIHGTVVYGVPKTLYRRYKFFSSVSYIIGGLTYSLFEIENGILRANRVGVGQLWPPFSRSDPRKHVALDAPEPLIHFGLVCGAKSCPPIKVYTSRGVEDELKSAVETFLEDDANFDINTDKNEILLSKIFSWYRKDFPPSNDGLALWLNGHLNSGEKKTKLETLLDKGIFKISYRAYDWTSNSV